MPITDRSHFEQPHVVSTTQDTPKSIETKTASVHIPESTTGSMPKPTDPIPNLPDLVQADADTPHVNVGKPLESRPSQASESEPASASAQPPRPPRNPNRPFPYPVASQASPKPASAPPPRPPRNPNRPLTNSSNNTTAKPSTTRPNASPSISSNQTSTPNQASQNHAATHSYLPQGAQALAKPANAADPSTHGQLGGESTNVIAEAGNLASSAGHASFPGAVVAGLGETAYMGSGLAAAYAAANKMASDLSSASPASKLDIMGHGIQVLQGISGATSGGTGVASAIVGVHGSATTAEKLGQASSATWAISEGINALQHAHKLASSLYAHGGLNQEQSVHFGQLVGSAMKLTGIGLSLGGGSATTATALQAGGSAAAVMAGSLNLYQKGYSPAATMSYIGGKVSDAASAVGNMVPGRKPNPEPDSMV